MKAVAETIQLKEREVGGADSEQTLEPAGTATQHGEATTQPRPAGAGALAAFMLGLLLGRRQHSDHQ